MDADAEAAVRALAAALHQASVRVCGVTPEIGPLPTESNDSSEASFPAVTNGEAAEFVEIINTFLNGTSDARSKRHLLYEINPKLVPCIVSFVQSPHLVTPGDGTGQLMFSSLQCLISVVCCCCTDHILAEEAQQRLAASSLTDVERELSSVTCEVLEKLNLVHSLVGALNPIFPEDIQRCAAELLFALLLRSVRAKESLARSKSLSVLYASLSEQASPKMRAYIAASVRELANTHSSFMTDIEVLDLLNRLHALDESSDVRALAAETLDVLFRAETSAWASCPRRKELAAACVSRLETDSVSEVVHATLKLVETALLADGQLRLATEASFTDFFVANFGDRILVSLMEPGTRTGSLCARNLRLLVQYAPHYRFVAFGLHQHFPSISKLTKLTVHLATDPNMRDVVSQIMKVELAMALALTLAQDSRCRQLLSSQLHDYSQWALQLRTATLANLNGAALDYFSGVEVVDATGTNLCALNGVEWEAGGRPTRASIERLLLDQEDRWNQAVETTNAPLDADSLEGFGHNPDREVRLQRLAFILLSFSVHVTLSAASGGDRSLNDENSAAPSGSSSQAPPASTNVPGGTQVFGGVSHGGPQPKSAPTRTSLMRQYNSNPEKFAAVQRVAGLRHGSASHVDDDGGGATSASYIASNFVDPLKQPSADSFHRVGSKGKSASPTRVLFSKFDHALKLCSHFAQFYDKPPEPKPVVYETTDDGFVRRVPSSSVASTHGGKQQQAGSSRKGGSGGVMGGGDGSRSWTVQQLKEGDLFFFSIPLVALDTAAVEHVRSRAIRHLSTIKKAFIITPQVAKARRWFLFDMSNHIMPSIIHTLSKLIELFALHGEEAVKFPILMFREGGGAEGAVDSAFDPSHFGQQGGGHNSSSAAGDIDGVAALHSGNLIETMDQVRFYFNKVSERRGPSASTELFRSKRKSTYLEDLERKMSALGSLQFTGAENRAGVNKLLSLNNDNDDDDDLSEIGIPSSSKQTGGTARVLSDGDY